MSFLHAINEYVIPFLIEVFSINKGLSFSKGVAPKEEILFDHQTLTTLKVIRASSQKVPIKFYFVWHFLFPCFSFLGSKVEDWKLERWNFEWIPGKAEITNGEKHHAFTNRRPFVFFWTTWLNWYWFRFVALKNK